MADMEARRVDIYERRAYHSVNGSWADHTYSIPSPVTESDNHCNHHPTFYITASIASYLSKGNGNDWEDTCSSQNGTSISCACGPLGVQNNVPDERNKCPTNYNRSTEFVLVGVYASEDCEKIPNNERRNCEKLSIRGGVS